MTGGYPRVNCCIAGCERGTTTIPPLPVGHISLDTGKGSHEFICAEHWRRVPRRWKSCRRRAHRRFVIYGWPRGMAWDDLTDDQRRLARQYQRISATIWRRMKARAENPFDGDPELEEIERRLGKA